MQPVGPAPSICPLLAFGTARLLPCGRPGINLQTLRHLLFEGIVSIAEKVDSYFLSLCCLFVFADQMIGLGHRIIHPGIFFTGHVDTLEIAVGSAVNIHRITFLLIN